LLHSYPTEISVSLRDLQGNPINENINAMYDGVMRVQINFIPSDRYVYTEIGARLHLPQGLEVVPSTLAIDDRLNPDENEHDMSSGAVRVGALGSRRHWRNETSFEITVDVRLTGYPLAFGENLLEIRVSLGRYVDGILFTGEAIAIEHVVVVRDFDFVTQPLQLGIGVHNQIDAFENVVYAELGDELLVQFSFNNVSGIRFDSINAQVSLHEYLEFVSGSTRLFTHANPSGIYIADGIASHSISLGAFGSLDEDGRGSGSVSFRVRVSEDIDFYGKGAGFLSVLCSVIGYINNEPVTNFVSHFAEIIVPIPDLD
jgi:hypothetical protein